MNAHFNSTIRPANAKPWVGAMVYPTEVVDDEALKPDSYVVSEVSDSAFKVDGWPHWLPFSRVDYLLPDFTTCSGDPRDRTIVALNDRIGHHQARATELEPAANLKHDEWSAACKEAGVWDGPGGRDIPHPQRAAASAAREKLGEETGYRAAREVWQYETMMVYLLEAAIFTIPANTSIGLAIQSRIAMTDAFDVTGLGELDEHDATKFSFHERRAITLAKTAERVARQHSGLYLGDLDLAGFSIDELSSLAGNLTKFGNANSEFSELGHFRVKLSEGGWDHTANGHMAYRIMEWFDCQHDRVIEAIMAAEPADRDDAYERTSVLVEQAWRNGETLQTIRELITTGIGQQGTFGAPARTATATAIAEPSSNLGADDYDINDLESDISHLDHLIESIADQVMNLDSFTFADGSRNTGLDRVAALVWIARDMTNKAVTNIAGISSGAAIDRAAAAAKAA